jgi:hypothetical protein
MCFSSYGDKAKIGIADSLGSAVTWLAEEAVTVIPAFDGNWVYRCLNFSSPYAKTDLVLQDAGGTVNAKFANVIIKKPGLTS